MTGGIAQVTPNGVTLDVLFWTPDIPFSFRISLATHLLIFSHVNVKINLASFFFKSYLFIRGRGRGGEAEEERDLGRVHTQHGA